MAHYPSTEAYTRKQGLCRDYEYRLTCDDANEWTAQVRWMDEFKGRFTALPQALNALDPRGSMISMVEHCIENLSLGLVE